MRRQSLWITILGYFLVALLALVINWTSDATSAVFDDRRPLLFILLLIVFLSGLAYHLFFDSGSTVLSPPRVTLPVTVPRVVAEAVILAVMATAVGAVAATLPIIRNVIDFIRIPLVRTGYDLPWLLLIAVAMLVFGVAIHQDYDRAIGWSLCAVTVLTAFAIRPQFGAEHQLNSTVSDAVDWDGSELKWFQGGRQTSLSNEGFFRYHPEPLEWAWNAVKPDYSRGFPAYGSLLRRQGGVDGTYVTVVGTAVNPPSEPIAPYGPDRVAPWAWQVKSPHSEGIVDVLYWQRGPDSPICPHLMAVTGLPLAYSEGAEGHILIHLVDVACIEVLPPAVTVAADRWVNVIDPQYEVPERSLIGSQERATNLIGVGIVAKVVTDPGQFTFNDGKRYSPSTLPLVVVGTIGSAGGFESDLAAQAICTSLLLDQSRVDLVGQCRGGSVQLDSSWTTG